RPTQTPTLSLPAALPILQPTGAQDSQAKGHEQERPDGRSGHDDGGREGRRVARHQDRGKGAIPPRDGVSPGRKALRRGDGPAPADRKSTRLNSSHDQISY